MRDESLEQKYRAEIARLDEEYAFYQRMWSKVPQFALVALLAPVVGAVWGWGAAVVELLVSAALVGTRAYLIAMRKSENRWNRERLVADLDASASEPVGTRREAVHFGLRAAGT